MKPLRPIPFALAVPLAVALAACGDDPAGLSADGVEPRLAVIPACVEFGPPPPFGTVYGAPVGTPPGTVVFVENGVRVSVNKFFTPATIYNYMRLEGPPSPFGFGQVARANNVNIGFDYSTVGFTVKNVWFEWLDQGGTENLIINGAGPFIGELDTPPASLGGVAVSSVSGPAPGGDKGTTKLAGYVRGFQVGGQELWIDRVCASP